MKASTPLAAICRTHLALPGAALAPELDRQLVSAIAPTLEVGPLLLNQERFLATFVEPEAAGLPVFAGFALSGGRLWAGGRAIPLDALRRVRRAGMETIELSTTWGPAVLRTAAAEALFGIVSELLQLPQRFEYGQALTALHTRPPVGPIPESFDRETDLWVASIYRLLWAMEHRGGPAPTTALLDFAQRAVLLGRTLADGRGMNEEGLWLSALSPPDLADALLAALQDAKARPRGQAIELRFASTVQALLGRAAAQGHAWAEHGAAVDAPFEGTITVHKLGTMSGFSFEFAERPQQPAALRRAVFSLLLPVEQRVTVARTLRGWTETATALLDLPYETLGAQAHAIDSGLDLVVLLGVPSAREQQRRDEVARETAELLARRQSRRDALSAAQAQGDSKLVLERARELAAHHSDYEHAHRVMSEISERDPSVRCHALVMQGEAALATLGSLPSNHPEGVALAERAVAAFEEALRKGAAGSELDLPYFAAARVLSERHPSPHRRRGALDVYLRSFPHGERRGQAEELLAGTARGAGQREPSKP